MTADLVELSGTGAQNLDRRVVSHDSYQQDSFPLIVQFILERCKALKNVQIPASIITSVSCVVTVQYQLVSLHFVFPAEGFCSELGYSLTRLLSIISVVYYSLSPSGRFDWRQCSTQTQSESVSAAGRDTDTLYLCLRSARP